jgi:NADH dehydrogenase (ubiquinone) flavoprotein 1
MISRAAAPSPSSIANLSSRSLRVQGSAARSFASVQDTTHPVRHHGGLRDQDRIFTNLYGHHGADLKSAMKFGDWHRTKDIVLKGHDWVRLSFAATEDILWPSTRVAGLYWTLRLIYCA